MSWNDIEVSLVDTIGTFSDEVEKKKKQTITVIVEEYKWEKFAVKGIKMTIKKYKYDRDLDEFVYDKNQQLHIMPSLFEKMINEIKIK